MLTFTYIIAISVMYLLYYDMQIMKAIATVLIVDNLLNLIYRVAICKQSLESDLLTTIVISVCVGISLCKVGNLAISLYEDSLGVIKRENERSRKVHNDTMQIAENLNVLANEVHENIDKFVSSNMELNEALSEINHATSEIITSVTAGFDQVQNKINSINQHTVDVNSRVSENLGNSNRITNNIISLMETSEKTQDNIQENIERSAGYTKIADTIVIKMKQLNAMTEELNVIGR